MTDRPHFALVVSRFNSEVTEGLLDGAKRELLSSGLSLADLEIFRVPGAVEIPLMAQRCARSRRFDAILCLGAVIAGDTDHYHYVCEQVSQGCLRVSLDESVPVLFGVLTTRTEDHAVIRSGAGEGNKGAETARAALDLIESLRAV